MSTWYLAVAYAAGFAAGNSVGIYIEGKLAIGTELVRAVSQDPKIKLAEQLRGSGYNVVELAGTGNGALVEVLLVVEKRRCVPGLLSMIDTTDPGAYYTISDVKEKVSQYRDAGMDAGLRQSLLSPKSKRKLSKRK